MSTSSSSKQLGESDNQERMGVASMSSKRRLENCDGELEGPSPIKIAKKSVILESDHQDIGGQHEKFTSEFLTTSILARTLLTSSNSSLSLSSSNQHHVLTPTSPLESLKSSLESLPTTSFLESLEELHGGSYHLPTSTKLHSVQDAAELEFNGLLCHDRMTTITVLSPIDETTDPDGSSWIPPSMSKMNPFGMMSEQVITEDENGKSYFNLGPSEATVLAKKSSSNASNSPPDQTWTANGSNVDYLDEASSSSSCESISSEDLFNSCEEYDISEDEEEVRTYKQERSNVLHLSLCKLNMFRTQQCSEPSLHRSVLICNTLRHIEQEIRNEDEVRHTPPAPAFLESRETIPPFWPPTSTSNSNSANNNTGPSSGTAGSTVPETLSAATEVAPERPPNNGGHDPYLSPSSYNDSPYSAAYDYNSPLRPSQTPFHSASYDYSEPELNSSQSPLQQSSPVLSELVEEMDSGMSAYYYATPVQSEFSATGGGNEGAGYMACSSAYGNLVEPTLNLVPPSSVASIVEILSSELGSSASDMGDIPSASNSSSSASSNDSMNSSDYLDSSSDSSTSSMVDSLDCWAKLSPSSTAIQAFAQQDSQCGMESLRTDFSLGNHGHSHHHQLPMDSLVSSAYSPT